MICLMSVFLPTNNIFVAFDNKTWILVGIPALLLLGERAPWISTLTCA